MTGADFDLLMRALEILTREARQSGDLYATAASALGDIVLLGYWTEGQEKLTEAVR